MTPDQISQIVKLRDSGMKWVEISKVLGKHFSTCSNAYYKAKGNLPVPVVTRVHT